LIWYQVGTAFGYRDAHQQNDLLHRMNVFYHQYKQWQRDDFRPSEDSVKTLYTMRRTALRARRRIVLMKSVRRIDFQRLTS
jgi:hypothetical protein